MKKKFRAVAADAQFRNIPREQRRCFRLEAGGKGRGKNLAQHDEN